MSRKTAPRPRHLDHPRDAAVFIVRTLQRAGFTAYFAGGCVRDELMGQREPDDYDIATDAHPEQVRSLFHRTRAVGEHFGVVLVEISKRWYEVATFRTEWGYSDKRRPDAVQYSDAEHDAQRRDFTINGLFKDPIADRIIDYVGGRDDLSRGVIRAIGDPHERLAEDHLRALRAVRFAARFGFDIEQETSAAIVANAQALEGISRERIGHEVRAMLQHENRSDAIDLLEAHTLDIPTLQSPTSVRSQAKHPAKATASSVSGSAGEEAPCVLGELPRRSDVHVAVALAAWAIDRFHCDARESNPPLTASADANDGFSTSIVGESRLQKGRRRLKSRWDGIIIQYSRALVLSNDEAYLLRFLLEMRDQISSRWHAMSVAAQKRIAGDPRFAPLQQLLAAERPGQAARIEKRIEELRSTPGGLAPEPLLTGDDLIRMGLKPSPAFRSMLEAVYDAQLENRISSVEEARSMIQNMNKDERGAPEDLR